jgi:hypothetical protein
MAEALNYERRSWAKVEGHPMRRRHVPSAFEVKLFESEDLPAVSVIEAALRRRGLTVHRDEGDQGVKLFVPARERDYAALLAAEIFARRQRIALATPVHKPDERPDWTFYESGFLG